MKNPGKKKSGLFGFWQNMSGMFSRPRNTFMAYAIALGGLLGGLTGCSKENDPAKPDPVNPPATAVTKYYDKYAINRDFVTDETPRYGAFYYGNQGSKDAFELQNGGKASLKFTGTGNLLNAGDKVIENDKDGDRRIFAADANDTFEGIGKDGVKYIFKPNKDAVIEVWDQARNKPGWTPEKSMEVGNSLTTKLSSLQLNYYQ